MLSQLEEIRDQQRQTWDKFAAGWNKWDELAELACPPWASNSSAVPPYGRIRTYLTWPPVRRAGATFLPTGIVTITDLSERMLEVAAENARRRGTRNLQTMRCQCPSIPGQFIRGRIV